MPVAPASPEAPATPGAPAAPVAPPLPGSPAPPSLPGIPPPPGTPAAPVAPASPDVPAVPSAPASPGAPAVAPATPVGPPPMPPSPVAVAPPRPPVPAGGSPASIWRWGMRLSPLSSMPQDAASAARNAITRGCDRRGDIRRTRSSYANGELRESTDPDQEDSKPHRPRGGGAAGEREGERGCCLRGDDQTQRADIDAESAHLYPPPPSRPAPGRT